MCLGVLLGAKLKGGEKSVFSDKRIIIIVQVVVDESFEEFSGGTCEAYTSV